jgi:surface polysaccharide O-acyltransferase-like enzyme
MPVKLSAKARAHVPALDVMRLIAILAVVLIHTTTKTLNATGYDLNTYWWPLFLNQISRFAVPMFFLISGFVLELNYNKHPHYFIYLNKRLSKIITPYLFWSLIYYFLVYRGNLTPLPRIILWGEAAYQLYFIPSLMIFYLIYPLFHRLYNILAHPLMLLTLGAVQIRILYQDYYVKDLPYEFPISIALMAFYVFILGMVASHNQEKILAFAKKWFWALVTLTISLGLAIFVQGRARYHQTWNIHAFYSQWRPSILVFTLGLSATLYHWLSKTKNFSATVNTLSGLSFFVFFFHLIPVEWFWSRFGLINAWWYDLAFFLAVAAISFGVGYLVRKVPFLARLTG